MNEDPIKEFRPAFPLPDWTQHVTDKQGRPVPQTIAHRGFAAKHPENTMAAFRGAADIEAHAIETDIHLSKDGVAVISHDPTLRRCFGVDKKIIKCDWKFLSTVRTLKAPHERMPRLTDLLRFLAEPGNEHMWLLLDIKVDNKPNDVMKYIAAAIDSVEPSPTRAWQDRVMLGCWATKFLLPCAKYLPGFPITHIGYCLTYARQFLQIPNISFTMLQKAMMGPYGPRFIRDVQQAGRPLFLWTVDDAERMKWCIKHQVDGVITDDPELFRDVVSQYDENEEIHFPFKSMADVFRVNFFITLFGWMYHLKHRAKVEPQFITK